VQNVLLAGIAHGQSQRTREQSSFHCHGPARHRHHTKGRAESPEAERLVFWAGNFRRYCGCWFVGFSGFTKSLEGRKPLPHRFNHSDFCPERTFGNVLAPLPLQSKNVGNIRVDLATIVHDFTLHCTDREFQSGDKITATRALMRDGQALHRELRCQLRAPPKIV
jgi:hypothetical protein